jgi:hypothetical protein
MVSLQAETAYEHLLKLATSQPAVPCLPHWLLGYLPPGPRRDQRQMGFLTLNNVQSNHQWWSCHLESGYCYYNQDCSQQSVHRLHSRLEASNPSERGAMIGTPETEAAKASSLWLHNRNIFTQMFLVKCLTIYMPLTEIKKDGIRFEVFMAVTMKNVVFWDIRTQFVLHRRHIMSPLQSSAS